MQLHEDAFFVITQGWLKGWRVKVKRTGATCVPPADIAEKMGLTWIKVRKSDRFTPQIRERGEFCLMQMFGYASSEPHGAEATRFRNLAPSELADAAFSRAAYDLATLRKEAAQRAEAAQSPPRQSDPVSTPEGPWLQSERHDIGHNRVLWWTSGSHLAWVQQVSGKPPKLAPSKDAEKLHEAVWWLRQVTDPGPLRDLATQNLYFLFCSHIDYQLDSREFFTKHDAKRIADGVTAAARDRLLNG